MISEENNNVMCKNKSKQEMGDRKTKLNHSPSTTSIGSIDLSTFATDPQNDDRDFQNRSPILKKQMKMVVLFLSIQALPRNTRLAGLVNPFSECTSAPHSRSSFAEKSPELV